MLQIFRLIQVIHLKNSAQYATLLRAFLAGYRSIRPLDPDHEAHIDVLIAAEAIWGPERYQEGLERLRMSQHFATTGVLGQLVCMAEK